MKKMINPDDFQKAAEFALRAVKEATSPKSRNSMMVAGCEIEIDMADLLGGFHSGLGNRFDKLRKEDAVFQELLSQEPSLAAPPANPAGTYFGALFKGMKDAIKASDKEHRLVVTATDDHTNAALKPDRLIVHDSWSSAPRSVLHLNVKCRLEGTALYGSDAEGKLRAEPLVIIPPGEDRLSKENAQRLFAYAAETINSYLSSHPRMAGSPSRKGSGNNPTVV